MIEFKPKDLLPKQEHLPHTQTKFSDENVRQPNTAWRTFAKDANLRSDIDPTPLRAQQTSRKQQTATGPASRTASHEMKIVRGVLADYVKLFDSLQLRNKRLRRRLLKLLRDLGGERTKVLELKGIVKALTDRL